MKLSLLLITLLISGSLYAQNDEILTNQSVVTLFSKGLSPTIIISKIKTTKSTFDVSTNELIKLKEANIPDDIVNAMVEASSNKTDNNEVLGDPNDPNAYHSSGLYIYQVVDDKPQMMELEPTVLSQTHGGSGLGAALTYGLASTNVKAKLSGGKSNLQINTNKPVFYFYFDKGSNLNTSSTFFLGATSPNEFILVKLYVRSKGREFVIGSENAFTGTSIGVEQRYKVDFIFERIKPGIYKVTPRNSLVPGEYCFMYAGGATGKVYDFGVSK